MNETVKPEYDDVNQFDCEVRKSRIKDCHISSDLNICSNLGLENLNTSSYFQRRSSDKSRVSQNRASFGNENKANILSSGGDNEQQSSSIPNVSCDLNCVNDERLDQPELLLFPEAENKNMQNNCKAYESNFTVNNLELSFSKEKDTDCEDCSFTKCSKNNEISQENQYKTRELGSPKTTKIWDKILFRPKELSPLKIKKN